MSRLCVMPLAILVGLLANAGNVAQAAAPLNLIANPGFERGQRGWKPSWDENTVEVACDAGQAHDGRNYVVLSAKDANVGIDSQPLYVGPDIDISCPYVVSVWTANSGIERGQFGLRVYGYDADGKYLAMKSFGNWGPGTAKSGWQRIEVRVGPGTGFPFPNGLDYIVVRFSFWDESGLCRGRVLIDDVAFTLAQGELKPSVRMFERSAKGAIAIWSDDVPGAVIATDPGYLAARLQRAGYGVHLITTDELADPSVLSAAHFDLLVLPYGEVYPATGAETLRRFLRRGTQLITLGGPCFRQPLWPVDGGWSEMVSHPARLEPPRPIVEPSEQLAAALTKELSGTDQPANVSLGHDPDGDPSLRIDVDDLQFYVYVRLRTRSTVDYNVLRFRAKGDADTKHLCIECNEADGSRWKAAVDLSLEWQTYEVPAGEFVSYASENRGSVGDYLHVENVRRVAFGFPRSMVGTGKRSFEISGIEWLASDVSPDQFGRGALLLADPSVLVRAFGHELKNLSRGGDITAFLGAEAFCEVDSLTAAQGQTIFPKDFVLRRAADSNAPSPRPAQRDSGGEGRVRGGKFLSAARLTGGFSGSTATLPETNAYTFSGYRATRRHSFLPTEKTARVVPLLLTPDGRAAASLFHHVDGPYAGGVWACFGVTNRNLFPSYDPAMGEAFVTLVDRMLGRASLVGIEPRFVTDSDGVRMEILATVANHGMNRQKLDLHTSLEPAEGGNAWREEKASVDLCPGAWKEVLLLRASADQFDWKGFAVACRLRADGATVDTIQTSVDVRATLRAICDRFVRRQHTRADGKIHGYGFVDNRGVRALLAAYELFDCPEYLEAAIRWGEATLAEQRDDGGYLMGYGYYPEGNECFVADGGEIACAVARLIAYVPGEDRGRYFDSLKSYVAYRDSFRSEGGGIGVGWCKSDYGSRPIERLDKITRILAPDMNIYTIGCTLTAATMYARLTKDPKDNEAAVRDAFWWMGRCKSTSGGASAESAVWAHAYLRGDEIHPAIEQFLRDKFVPHVVQSSNRWWTTGGGRTVQGLDGLAYYYDCVEKDPQVLAALMRVTYHVCSPEALSGIPRILQKKELSPSEWLYLNFAAVSLPNLLESEITREDNR